MEKNSPDSKRPKLNNDQMDTTVPRHESPGTAGDVPARDPPARRELLSSTSPGMPGYAAVAAGLSSSQPPPWFVQFFTEFENRLDARIESLLDKKLGDLTSKISEQDEKMKSLSFDLDSLRDSVQALQTVNQKLERKLDDLENRSRRNNLVVFGIQESSNTNKEDCKKLIHDFLHFADVADEDIKDIQRCHRTPSYRPHVQENVPQYPRRIHIGFGSFTAKERARKACINKLKATKSLFQDHKVFVAEDLSQHVLQLRKSKAGSFKRLKEEGKRPFFVFPDKLCYRDPDGKFITA